MTIRVAVYDFIHRMNRDANLRADFERDPAAVLEMSGFDARERRLLLDGSFTALAELGMHPLVGMVYALRRTPAFAQHISFRDYLRDLD